MIPRHLARSVLLRRAALALVAFAGILGLASPGVRAASPGSVVILPTEGIVDQVMAGYISDGIANAGQAGAAAVIIRLDTPGGSLDSMREIVQSELEAPLPVIVWVSPSGARAASAGTFITLAANIVAMESGTNIGAATPVDSSGQDITGAEGQKVTNDAVALMTSICETRSRPVPWAVATIQSAASYTVDQAIAAGAADIKSDSLPDLLAQLNGRTVTVGGGRSVVLQTAGAPTTEVDLNLWQSFLHLLADPNIAFILFTIGFYGLIFEVAHPNFVTGTVGALSIILAFVGFGNLPLNIAGLLLVGLSILMFVIDLHVVSHGVITIGGLVVFILGAGTLYSAPGTPAAPSVQVAWPVIAVMAGITALIVFGILRVAWRSRHMPKVNIGVAGTNTLLPPGTEGSVRRALAPKGTVYAAGEEWTARSADGSAIERGSPVQIVGQDGLVLLVRPLIQMPAVPGFGPAPR